MDFMLIWVAAIVAAPIVTYLLAYCVGRGFSSGRIDAMRDAIEEEDSKHGEN